MNLSKPAVSVDIQIATEEDDHPPPSSIEQWIAITIDAASKTTHNTNTVTNINKRETELSLRIVDEEEITDLNNQYRGKNTSTNVLSFPADIPTHIDIQLLGDIVICSQVVEREAQDQCKKKSSHWAHMIVHGTLHLLGYDHISDDEAEIMEGLEIDILNQFGIENPYLINASLEKNKTTIHL